MKEQDEYIHDLRFQWRRSSMFSRTRNLSRLLSFVREHGTVHLGYVSRNELPTDWPSRQYWRDTDLMEKLENENLQTAQYVKFGLLAALPDWRVVEFLKEKAGWPWSDAAKLVGWTTDHQNTVRYR